MSPKISKPDTDTKELAKLQRPNANLCIADQMFSLDMMGFDENDLLEVADIWVYIHVAL